MPFGFTIATATFQRLKERCFWEEVFNTLLVFYGDIIDSKTLREQMFNIIYIYNTESYISIKGRLLYEKKCI